MARTKQLNIVVTFMGTPYVINDLGFGKTPRFELHNQTSQQVESKSNNPKDFDSIVWEDNENVEPVDFVEETQTRVGKRRGRRKKLTKI